MERFRLEVEELYTLNQQLFIAQPTFDAMEEFSPHALLLPRNSEQSVLSLYAGAPTKMHQPETDIPVV